MGARPGSRAVRLAVALLAALALAGCGAATLPQVHSESERLTAARGLMARGDWGNATELLKTYIQNNGGAEKVDEAIVLIGVCYLQQKDYTNAQTEFERLLRDFPESDSAGSASFLLGEAFWGGARGVDFDQEDTQKAVTQWDSYLSGYPDHVRHAEGVQRRVMARTRLARKTLDTADLYWKMRYNHPARMYYQKVVDEYGDTPLVGDALLGLALCDARDGKRDEGIATLQDLETRFPGTPLAARAAQERGRIAAGKIKPTRPPKPIPKAEGEPGATP